MLGPTTGLELGDSVLFLLFGGSIYCGSRRYLVVRLRWPTRRLEQYGSPFISCDVGAPAGGHPLSHSRIGRMKHRGSRYCRVVRERSPAPRLEQQREREIDEEEDMIASSSRSSASDGVRKRGRGKRVDSSASATASASDLTDATSEEEERAVGAFRRALIDRNLLPACHDDYHTMKRSVLIADLSYHF
ncbi:hypothetical protein B296_00058455 [Ensete ventricosum]|uniref:Uncharacterized protein n=1 Tax=Ensete ventricosum TaxID=4639 RepID=A0A426WZ69_ENSVE|nr:hypothetical protein B296_00058455 [Ensete ventricosum]